MSSFLVALFAHTPRAVWALLLALVAVGLGQTRPREVSAARLVLLPLALGALSLWSTGSAFGAGGPLRALAGWLAGAAAGFALNRALDLPRRASALGAGRYRIEGSLAPLGILLAVFALRYANGVALALHPGLAGEGGYALALSAAFGAPAGLLAARTRKVLALSGPAAWASA